MRGGILSKVRCNKGWLQKKRGHVCSGGRADVCMMFVCCNYEKGHEPRLHQGLLHVRIIYIMLNVFEEWLIYAVFDFRGKIARSIFVLTVFWPRWLGTAIANAWDFSLAPPSPNLSSRPNKSHTKFFLKFQNILAPSESWGTVCVMR